MCNAVSIPLEFPLMESRGCMRGCPLPDREHAARSPQAMASSLLDPSSASMRARKGSLLRVAYHLIISLLIIANVVFIASRFRSGSLASRIRFEEHEGRVLERKDVEGRSTALTRPSVSCDLCPGSDDFCIDLGYARIPSTSGDRSDGISQLLQYRPQHRARRYRP